MAVGEGRLPVSGANMDEVVPRKRRPVLLIAVAAVVLIAVAATAIARMLPTGLRVSAQDLRIEPVAATVFNDDVIVRAVAEPALSVVLDAIETGRVEEVLVKDGAAVKQGDLLFRLSNPQRRLEVLARESDYAQLFSTYSTMRVQYETTRTDYRRRINDLQAELVQIEKQYRRDAQLGEIGFISHAALEESEDKLATYKKNLADEKQSQSEELNLKQAALEQMKKALTGVEDGLKVVNANVEALAVRAPITGRLTNFDLKVGSLAQSGDHIGRIDDPDQFKLTAQVDEFYLPRVALGQHASVIVEGRRYMARVTRSDPQVKDGRFSVELLFDGTEQPALRAGQSVDCQLTLGEPSPAVVLPNGAFASETGGAWVYVVAADGRSAVRRPVRLGRRNNTQLEVLSGLQSGEKVIVSSYGAFGKSDQLSLSQ